MVFSLLTGAKGTVSNDEMVQSIRGRVYKK